MKAFGLPLQIGVDSIGITSDGARLLYGPLSGDRLYIVPTASLIDRALDATADVRTLGHKPSSDGIVVSSDEKVFMTAIEADGIALMQQEIVERRGWVPAQAFDRGLSFSMMLPGPEAQQLATWLGWRLHGVWGGLAAGLAFLLPGAALMIGLAWIAAAHGEVPLVAAVFAGVQPVVIALVLGAMGQVAAQVPLAEEAGRVARIAQGFRQGLLVGGHGQSVLQNAAARRVATGQ